jgi:cysteine desulfurase
MIYADNAATTRLKIEAYEAMKPFLLDVYGNASQPYSFARPARKALKEARAIIANCIGALPEEIYFTSGGTESNNWAIKGSAFSDVEKRGTITCSIEHHTVLRTCESIERLGYPVTYLPVDNTGQISLNDLETFISNSTRLVSIMLSNNEIGTIQPVKELVKIAHAHGAIFHTDAVQSVGHIKIDVNDLGVDMLSASAHKFGGPKGIGFIYIRKGTVIAPYLDGGSQELGMRAGTENVAFIVGMATALKLSCEDLGNETSRLQEFEKLLLDSLKSANIDFVRNGSENKIAGNISLSFNGRDGEALLHRLDLMGICASAGSACDSTETQISHVLREIHLPDNYAKGTIRISLGKENTLDDVRKIAFSLQKILVTN